jgi:hypothetical protein
VSGRKGDRSTGQSGDVRGAGGAMNGPLRAQRTGVRERIQQAFPRAFQLLAARPSRLAPAQPGVTVALAKSARERVVARTIVAGEYAKLAVPEVSLAAAYRDLFDDEPARKEERCVKTYLAKKDGEIVGTAGYRLPDPAKEDEAYRQFEAMRLMKIRESWLDVLGYAPGQLGEWTRFALTPAAQASLTPAEKAGIVRDLVALARRDSGPEIRAMIAIQPYTVFRLFKGAGVQVRFIDGVTLALEDEANVALFERYGRYWLPEISKLAPRLGILELSANSDDNISDPIGY